MGDTCVPSLIVIGTVINQLETNISVIYITNTTLLPEAIKILLLYCKTLQSVVFIKAVKYNTFVH